MSRHAVNERPEAGSRHGVRRDRPGTPAGESVSCPEWARDAVIYAAYPRAFTPGTLEGVRRRLGHIRELGAEILWLLPIHPIGQAGRKGPLGSPYAIRDYLAVNPEYGSEADLARLVGDAHAAGLRVILDLVVNHAALDHPAAAATPGWFQRDYRGRPTRRIPRWSDVIDWNHAEPLVREHLLGAVERWVREFDIDGYRCDVAGMVPRDFWLEARRRLLKLRPDHFLLAEWDDPALHRSAFHATYDWQLYRALAAAVHRRRPAATLGRILERRHAAFPAGSAPLRFVENHDERRVLDRFGSAAPAATLFTALSGGLFLVHNGQEVGARHRPSLFRREPIDWDGPGAREAGALLREALLLRNEFREFGPVSDISDAATPEVAAYGRRSGRGGGLVVALNAAGHHVPLPAGPARAVEGLTFRGLWPGRPQSCTPGRLPPRSVSIWC